MKRGFLLNRHLSELVASLGHLDEIVIADAGLPVPTGVRAIDLAVSPGVPDFFEVLAALRSELIVEAVVFAEEVSPDLRGQLEGEVTSWSAETGRPIAISTISHEAFKHTSRQAKAIVRTGETTPYANIILVSGVAF